MKTIGKATNKATNKATSKATKKVARVSVMNVKLPKNMFKAMEIKEKIIQTLEQYHQEDKEANAGNEECIKLLDEQLQLQKDVLELHYGAVTMGIVPLGCRHLSNGKGQAKIEQLANRIAASIDAYESK